MATTTRVKCVLCDKRVPRDETKPTPIEVKGKQRRICKECDKAFERQGAGDEPRIVEYCPNCAAEMDGRECTECDHIESQNCMCDLCLETDDDWDDEDWGY